MVEGQESDICDSMAKAIEFISQQNASKRRRIDNLSERIRKMEAQASPDVAQIAELKSDIAELERELEDDDAQLGGFQEEFSALCGPE